MHKYLRLVFEIIFNIKFNTSHFWLIRNPASDRIEAISVFYFFDCRRASSRADGRTLTMQIIVILISCEWTSIAKRINRVFHIYHKSLANRTNERNKTESQPLWRDTKRSSVMTQIVQEETAFVPYSENILLTRNEQILICAQHSRWSAGERTRKFSRHSTVYGLLLVANDVQDA